MTRMILLDVVIVSLSNVPFGMFLIYGVTKALNRFLTPTETLLFTLAQLIGSIQVFGSFYFYLLVSSAFRNNVQNMLRNTICFWKPRLTRRIFPSISAPGVQPILAVPTVATKMPGVVS